MFKVIEKFEGTFVRVCVVSIVDGHHARSSDANRNLKD
jgi:hypothetical protein